MRNVLIGDEDAHDSETPTAQCTDEAAEEHSGKRFAKARIDASGRAIPSRLADGSAVNMYERQLNHGRKRRMRPAGKATLAPAAPRQTPIDPMSDLKSALKEREASRMPSMPMHSLTCVLSENFFPAGHALSDLCMCACSL